MESFISSRIQCNEINFWDPFHKLKIRSFSLVAKKIDVKSQKGRIVSIYADRELFSRLQLLEKEVTCRSSLPSSQLPTACLTDAMPLIQMVKFEGSTTFAELSQKYADIVTSTLRRDGYTRVDLIFDQYRSVSIKAGERSN